MVGSVEELNIWLRLKPLDAAPTDPTRVLLEEVLEYSNMIVKEYLQVRHLDTFSGEYIVINNGDNTDTLLLGTYCRSFSKLESLDDSLELIDEITDARIGDLTTTRTTTANVPIYTTLFRRSGWGRIDTPIKITGVFGLPNGDIPKPILIALYMTAKNLLDAAQIDYTVQSFSGASVSQAYVQTVTPIPTPAMKMLQPWKLVGI